METFVPLISFTSIAVGEFFNEKQNSVKIKKYNIRVSINRKCKHVTPRVENKTVICPTTIYTN